MIKLDAWKVFDMWNADQSVNWKYFTAGFGKMTRSISLSNDLITHIQRPEILLDTPLHVFV